ncbi:hypothetical protein [Pseudonocardia oceani]|uniref:Uncharacterized protein n=1 Tax=Pseudonocardia oceani TaxID=2792013 RepID=A0ABS6UGV3_9PSEU|nr:hypothetical protein [Pseudonocardia oceani]MBW0131156.1 hypothetical protein [Pseudonocardia oceani]MBW0132582.1 hypothetical protein [Pseudonocardia oceani]
MPTGHIGIHEIELAANTESTVTFGGDLPSQYDLARVEVQVLEGTAPVYFRFGPSGAATVKGTDCWSVQPGTAVGVDVPTAGDTVVRLISAASAVVSVGRG